MRRVVILAALAAALFAPAHAAVRNPGNQVAAQPVGGDAPVNVTGWGTMGQMVEPVWVTKGLAVERTSIASWSVPGKVLIIRHGPTERMKLGIKYADIVQRIERNPATGKFAISYSYEDGRKLAATGAVEADGTFVEYLTNADGSKQRNRYVLDDPRKMRIVRQKPNGAGWANMSSAMKVGETPLEKEARLAEARAVAAAEQAQRELERARREAEEEQLQAEIEAERRADEEESRAQQARNWQNFQNTLNGIVQRQREMDDSSNRMLANIRANVARHDEEVRRKQEEARRAAAEAQRLRQEATQRQQQMAMNAQNARAGQQQAQVQQQQAEAERQRQALIAKQQQQQREQQQIAQANQQRAAQQAQQQRQQQANAEAQRKQQEAEAKRRAEAEPVAWKEGVTLCQEGGGFGGSWTCYGPLQNTTGTPGKPSFDIAVRQACGSDNTRDLGVTQGYRAFGCGFGISPSASMEQSYPGHRDQAMRRGVFVPGRGTFRCARNLTNFCKSR